MCYAKWRPFCLIEIPSLLIYNVPAVRSMHLQFKIVKIFWDLFQPLGLCMTLNREVSSSVNHNKASGLLWHLLLCWSRIDSFTVSLHSPNGRHLPAIRALQGDCQGPLTNAGNFHWPCKPTITIHCDWVNPIIYLDQPITKRWGHVTFGCPYAARLGPCNSLPQEVCCRAVWVTWGSSMQTQVALCDITHVEYIS